MTLQRFVPAGAVDAAILTHAHSDHYADLLQMWRLRMVGGTPKPLPLLGPSDAPPVIAEDPEAFELSVAQEADYQFGPLSVRLSRVEHGECWAVRIDDRLCYTADSEPCAALQELADGAAVLLAEACGFDAAGPMRGHLSAGDAARLARQSGAELLILTHLRPWQDHAALLDEAAAIAECPVVLATAGLRLNI